MNDIDRSRLERVVPGPEYPEVRERSAAIIPWTLLAVVVWVVAVLAIAAAASRGPAEHSPSHSPAEPAGGAGEVARPALGAPPSVGGLLARQVAPEVTSPAPEGMVGGAPTRYRGTATWYCLSGSSACTRGYGQSDLVAAIDADLGFAKGDRLVVRYRDRAVTVRVVDVCGCPGERLIDLTSGAFARLAPLGHGVIPVTVELAAAGSTLPPTETLP